MTSFKQIEANRQNSRKSTGPITAEGKLQSRRNAVRHGLTAETVIGALEDAGDYKAFEAAIVADYEAPSAVERELVLRLASVLWRLRRATAIETGLFEIEAGSKVGQSRNARPSSRDVIRRLFGPSRSAGSSLSRPARDINPAYSVDLTAELTRCYLDLTNLPSFALDRLSRYEATLWRQAGQIIFTLDALNRHKPRERRIRFPW
jgi:hypothetical protein